MPGWCCPVGPYHMGNTELWKRSNSLSHFCVTNSPLLVIWWILPTFKNNVGSVRFTTDRNTCRQPCDLLCKEPHVTAHWTNKTRVTERIFKLFLIRAFVRFPELIKYIPRLSLSSGENSVQSRPESTRGNLSTQSRNQFYNISWYLLYTVLIKSDIKTILHTFFKMSEPKFR